MDVELMIVHLSGSHDGRVDTILAHGTPPAVTIGRLSTCTVSLPNDPEVSRFHARLVWRQEAWWLEDTDSCNGTFVGEFRHTQRITSPVRLATSQVFRVGRVRFRLATAREQESSKAASAYIQKTNG